MLLTIHDANLQKVAFIDNEKQSTLNYYDDTWTRNLETGSSTFEFTVFKKAIKSDTASHKTYNYLNEKSFVSFKYHGKSYVFNVMTVEENEQTIKCYCENLNLELINEYANPYKATKAMSFVEYCNAMDLLNFTHLMVGINEISDQKRTLEWEGQDTKLARLLSLATKFDAEIDFDTELNADSSIKAFKVNVYHENDDNHQGVGRVRNDIQLTYGKNLKSIKRKIDKTGIYTMIRPTGKGKTKNAKGEEVETVVTIGGLGAWSENNADGVREFYQSGEALYAPLAAQMYPSTFTSGTQNDQWIRKDLVVESDNPTVIRATAIRDLKKNAYPALTYEVDGFIDAEIGDTIRIYDDGFNPILLIKARVTDQKISFTNPNSNKTTFANFKALENNLSDGIQAAFERLFEAAKPYTIKLATDNGVIFKNQIGQSLVTPTLYKGGKPVVAGVTWRWSLDGEVTTGMTYLVRGSSVTDTVTLTVAAYIGNDEVAVDEISLVNVVDGKLGTPGTPGRDGRTPYVHTAWANNETGTVGFSLDSSINKLYIGIYTDFEPNDSTDPKKYKWAKIKGDKGDKGEKGDPGQRGLDGLQGEKGEQGIPGKNGADGRTQYTHIAYAEKSTRINERYIKNAIRSHDGSVVAENGNSVTTKGGNHITKAYISFDKTQGGEGWIAVQIKNTHSTNNLYVRYNGLGQETNKNFQVVKVEPMRSYSFIGYAKFRDNYDFIQIAFDDVDRTGDLSFDINELNIYEEPPYINFTQFPNDATSYIGVYVDYKESDSDDITLYNWSLIKGADGEQGVPGKPGTDGRTPYLHIAYSTSNNGSQGFSTTDSTNKRYIGTYTDYTQADSQDYRVYNWSLIKGDDGNGIANVTNYYLATASSTGITKNSAGWTTTPQSMTEEKRYLWNYRVELYTDGTSKTIDPAIIGVHGLKGEKGDRGAQGIQGIQGIQGLQGIPGAAGKDGKTQYTHIAYADNATGGGFSQTNTNKPYIGMYVDFNATDSTNPTAYRWTKWKGEDGAQGVPGAKGVDGKTPYVHFAYANSLDGKRDFSNTNSTNKRYIGTYTDFTQNDSTDPTKYRWVDMVGTVDFGGVNLIRNSSFPTDFRHWNNENPSFVRIVTHPFYYNSQKTLFMIENRGTGELVYGTNRFEVERNTTYTLNFRGFANSATRNIDVFFLGRKNGETADFTVVNLVVSRKKMSVSGCEDVTVTFNSGEVDNAYLRFDNNGTDTTSKADFYFGEIDLYKGEFKRKWQPNPDDLQLQIDAKADYTLTQEQLNALNEKNQILEAEMQAKASMEAFSELEKAYNAFVKKNAEDTAQSEKDLIEAGRRIELLTTQFGGLAELKTFIDTYMKSTNEGLIIGKNDASSTIKVSSDRISMFSAGREVMYISQGVIHIDNGIFTASVQVGRFKTEQYHLNADMNVIRYVG